MYQSKSYKDPTNLTGRSKFGTLFDSFAVRDYRFIWAFYILNFCAMSMEMIAQGWLVLVVTDSPFWVGGGAGLRGLGQVAFGVIGGVISDRISRRVILIVIQILRACIFVWLGTLMIFGGIELWHLLGAAVLQGMLKATELPASEALVYDTVGQNRLLNALAIKHGASSLARVPGALVAGTVIATTGVGPCYLVIAGVLIFAPIPILLIRTNYRRAAAYESIWRNLKHGINYTFRNNSLRSLLFFSTIVEMFGFSHFVMLPVIARDVLEVGASGLGYLSAAGAVGGIVASLILASAADKKTKGFILTVSGICVGIFLLLFGLSPWYATSLILAALVGGALVAYDTTMGAMLQLISVDDMRGRVLGLYGLTFGFTPVGGFLSGIIATIISAPFAIGMGGVVILVSIFVTVTTTKGFKTEIDADFRDS